MKKLILIGTLALLCLPLNGQSANPVSREWTSFGQTIDINITSPRRFKLRFTAKVDTNDKHGFSSLYAYEKTKNGQTGFYLTMEDNPIKLPNWQTYEMTGTLTPNTKKFEYGGMCFYNGKFYFDKFELFLENEYGLLEPVKIKNASFEKKITNGLTPNWYFATSVKGVQIKVKEFENRNSEDAIDGDFSLLIEGKGIETDNLGIIGKEGSENPQIEAMISMLENLKARVVDYTQNLSQYNTDYLFDDKANRIGALIMHLAAAEAFYQVFTFEGRTFNEEETEKWQVALDLGSKAQEKFQGEEITYYLNIYNEVREKTIIELKKRDDDWFNEIQPAYQWSNQYAWFHVMEHQSSHLGQILFLRKRIPPEEEIILTPELKD